MGKLTAAEVLDAIIAENRCQDPAPRQRVLEVLRCSREDVGLLQACWRAAQKMEPAPVLVTVDDTLAFLARDLGPDFMLHLYRQLLSERMI